MACMITFKTKDQSLVKTREVSKKSQELYRAYPELLQDYLTRTAREKGVRIVSTTPLTEDGMMVVVEWLKACN